MTCPALLRQVNGTVDPVSLLLYAPRTRRTASTPSAPLQITSRSPRIAARKFATCVVWATGACRAYVATSVTLPRGEPAERNRWMSVFAPVRLSHSSDPCVPKTQKPSW